MPPWVTGRRSSVRRTVTSVVSRIGIASTSSGSTMLVSVAPAVVQLEASASEARPKPITWLPESPMKTRALRPGRRLKGRKPRQAPPSASATTSGSSPASWSSAATAKTAQETVASDAARPSMLSSRLKAFVIPTSQTRPDDRREHVVADDLDGQPGGEHDAGRRELGRELRDRLQRVDVVDEAGDEEDRAAAEDAEQLAARVGRADRDARRRRPRRGRGRSRRRRRPASSARASAHRTGRRRAARRRRRAAARRASAPRPRSRRPRRSRSREDRVEQSCKAEMCLHRPTVVPGRDGLRRPLSATASSSAASSAATCARSTRARCSGSPGRSRTRSC